MYLVTAQWSTAVAVFAGVRTKALVDNSYWPFVLMGQYLLYMLLLAIQKLYCTLKKRLHDRGRVYDSNSLNQVSCIELHVKV